jgi:hypothetical protein
VDERGSRWERHGAGVVGYVVRLGAVGALCAMAYHGECLDPGPPVALPEPGTPRAGLCDALPPGWLSVGLVVVPMLLAGLLAHRNGPGRPTTVVVATLLFAAQLAFPIWVSTLDFASTI